MLMVPSWQGSVAVGAWWQGQKPGSHLEPQVKNREGELVMAQDFRL